MSYKNNNLKKIRKSYWGKNNKNIQEEKNHLKKILIENKIFKNISEKDLEYFFDTLPSEIIIKAFGLGLNHPSITVLLIKHIQKNKEDLVNKKPLNIKYRAEP
ncbi:hypothetical protein P256_00409 [Acinetobacter nectaris CIP 110549]|uniref:Uncharacterized protein n=1 Tax=Acinetobacter nectaris CIP 110549 TaxID=1392540 RepID=V2TV61_9GAMM|nr:hypothetical protein [Acinetobacter nectaris]ESK39970.1 hypothetical protein P256_00409 [Acinetobacter nectaris CIP 110549]